MKKINNSLLQVLTAVILTAFSLNIATAQDQEVPSPPASTTGTISGVTVAINYSSPGVKGREVFGGLEAWDKVWRAGANNTTKIELSADAKIGGKTIPAGTYGLYMIPKENEDWVLIINTDYDREKHGAWGAYNYKEENDVARIPVKVTWSDESMERLEYEVTNKGIDFGWAKARLSIPIKKA